MMQRKQEIDSLIQRINSNSILTQQHEMSRGLGRGMRVAMEDATLP